MTALGLTVFLFVQIPVAEAVTFQEVKAFLIGNSDKEKVEEGALLQAAALQALTTRDTLEIYPVDEIEAETDVAQFVFEIRSGDTLWDRIENELTASFPEMTQEQKYYTTDRILDEMRAIAPAELNELGISSGNIDLIFPDESISFALDITVGESVDDVELELNTLSL